MLFSLCEEGCSSLISCHIYFKNTCVSMMKLTSKYLKLVVFVMTMETYYNTLIYFFSDSEQFTVL